MNSQTGTTQVSTRTLLLLFVALLALAGGAFNLRDRLNQKTLLTDGIIWKDDAQGVIVGEIEPDSPAPSAGIYRGDVLLGVSTTGGEPFEEVTKPQHVQIYLDLLKDKVEAGQNPTISYWVGHRNDAGDTIIHDGVADLELKARPTHKIRDLYLFIVGLAYLGIGVYFLLRQGRAPYVIHFFILCLLAFIAHSYSATEEMRTQFDKAVDLTDAIALILLAPAFVHFSAIYPARTHLFNRRAPLKVHLWRHLWMAVALYAPAVVLIVAEIWLRVAKLRALIPFSAVGLRAALSNTELIVYSAALIISCALIIRTFRQSRSLTTRQQLKWVIGGMVVATFAFTALYVPAFLTAASVSELFQMVSLAPLILIPLTFGYSIVRYRLVDVDVVMRRSFAYIIATLSVALLFGSVTAVSYEFLRSFLSQAQETAQSQRATLLIATIAMSLIAVLFAPVKNWIQERIDRLFYGEKYDYRVTLQDFGRTLSSTTELNPLLDSLMRRLKEVFPVECLAIFIEDQTSPSGFRVGRVEGVYREINLPTDFINILRAHSAANGIVRAESSDDTEDDDQEISESGSQRSFNYYVPCAVRARVAAVIALGRPTDGAPLSSEDTNLLRAISGYVAVAIENALLMEEQGQRAKELARLKEFNENIIESINVGVMVVNLAGRVTNWNSALEEIYGLRREQAIGQRITEVFQAEMLRTLRELMARSEWKSGESVNVYKFRVHSADGRDLTLNISLAALQSKTAEIEGTLVAIEDVTERVRLEEQLQQADKLSSIGLLAAGVAHEVNTPLTGISSYSQMLMQQIPEGDPRHLLLEKIYRQTSRASSIVNNLLNFSRVGDARLGPIDFNRVLDDTIQLLEAQLRNTQIEVVRGYATDLPLASGNAAKMQQVFMNLILNARDAMPDGGRLQIATEFDDADVIIRFRDTGTGIAPENLAKIYDPFFTTKQIGKGTGLGLAVSYGIIRDHSGHIHVESKPGEGTIFEITVPLITARQQLAVASD